MSETQDETAVPRTRNAVIVYDGGCPFCTAYVSYVRLRDSAGPVQLLDARQGGEWVRLTERLGLDLDQGMVLFFGGNAYHGGDCMHMIAVLSSPSGLFNRVSAALLRRRRVARFIYPALRGARNVSLRLLGRRRLSSHAEVEGDVVARGRTHDG